MESSGSQDRVATSDIASTEVLCKDSSSVCEETAVSVASDALQTSASSSGMMRQEKGSEDKGLNIVAEKQQCIYCSKWFKVLANHKICHKRPAGRDEDSESKGQGENSILSCRKSSSPEKNSHLVTTKSCSIIKAYKSIFRCEKCCTRRGCKYCSR